MRNQQRGPTKRAMRPRLKPVDCRSSSMVNLNYCTYPVVYYDIGLPFLVVLVYVYTYIGMYRIGTDRGSYMNRPHSYATSRLMQCGIGRCVIDHPVRHRAPCTATMKKAVMRLVEAFRE